MSQFTEIEQRKLDSVVAVANKLSELVVKLNEKLSRAKSTIDAQARQIEDIYTRTQLIEGDNISIEEGPDGVKTISADTDVPTSSPVTAAPAKITASNGDGTYSIDLYEDGLNNASTGSGTLEVPTMLIDEEIPAGTVVVAARSAVDLYVEPEEE